MEFDTKRGVCRISWSDAGIVRLRLPGDPAIGSTKVTNGAIPGFIVEAIGSVRRHMAGTPPSYDALPVDLADISSFSRAVLEETRRIPVGETCTYKEIARAIGRPHAARAVGGALARNPVPLLIPCHRVLYAGNRIGGFSAPGGARTKRLLLEMEAISS